MLRRWILAAVMLLAATLAAVPAKATTTPLQVFVVGHSIAHGYGSSDGQGWRRELSANLAAAGVSLDYTVDAVAGATAPDMLPTVSAVIAARPDLVVIELGTNDTGNVPAFKVALTKMVGQLLDLTTARIALCFEGYPAVATLAAGMGAVNDAIFTVGAAYGWTTATPGPRFAGWCDFQPIPTVDLGPDGIHPTDHGYDAMAHQIERGLAATYGWPAPPADNPPLTGHRP